MLTNKDYCDYDTCVALKELGFDEKCHGYYEPLKKCFNTISIKHCQCNSEVNDIGVIICPTLYEAQKWLREEKGIFSDIGLLNDSVFYYCIRQKKNNYWIEIYSSFFHESLFDDYGKFESFEEALAEGIKKSINILKKE